MKKKIAVYGTGPEVKDAMNALPRDCQPIGQNSNYFEGVIECDAVMVLCGSDKILEAYREAGIEIMGEKPKRKKSKEDS